MAISLVPVGLSSLYYQREQKGICFPSQYLCCRMQEPITRDAGLRKGCFHHAKQQSSCSLHLLALADSSQSWLWTIISSQKEIMRKAVHWTQKAHVLYWDNWGAKIWGHHWNLHLTHLKYQKYQLARICPARVWCVGFPLCASHLPTGLSLQIALLSSHGHMILIGNLTSEISDFF